MKNLVPWAISIISILLACLVFFGGLGSSQGERQVKKLNSVIDLYQGNSLIQYNSESSVISSELSVKSLDGTSFTLSELLAGDQKLILRISENHCDICVNQELGFVNKIQTEMENEDIIILASFSVFEKFKSFARLKGIHSNIYFVKGESISAPIESTGVPYLFLTDSRLIMDMVFIPSKDLPTNSKNYYYLIFDRFFGKQLESLWN